MYYGKGDENSYLGLKKQKSTTGRFFGKDLTNISDNQKSRIEAKKRGKSTKRGRNAGGGTRGQSRKQSQRNLVRKASKRNLKTKRSRSKKNRSCTPEFKEKEVGVIKVEKKVVKKAKRDKFKSKNQKFGKHLKVKKAEEFLREKLMSRKMGGNKTKGTSRNMSPLTTKINEEEQIITPVNKQPKLENKPVDLEKRAKGVRKFNLNQPIDKKGNFSGNGVLKSLLSKVKTFEIKQDHQSSTSFEFMEKQACDYVFKDPNFDSNASFYISEKYRSRIKEEMQSFDIDPNGPGADFKSMEHLNFAKIWQMMLKEVPRQKLRKLKIGAVQKDINHNMRAILVDWLIDIHRKFRISEQAMYLSVQIIDKILQKIPVAKHRFQLLGITALFIASKYEDIYPPALSDFSFVCADAYSDEDILLMEANILKQLDFNLIFVSPYNLLEAYFVEKKTNRKTRCLVSYLQSISLVSSKMIGYSSSVKSASSIFLAKKILEPELDAEVHQLEADFGLKGKISLIKNCAKDLVILLSKEGKSRLTASKRKFKHERYMGISKLQVCFKKDGEE